MVLLSNPCSSSGLVATFGVPFCSQSSPAEEEAVTGVARSFPVFSGTSTSIGVVVVEERGRSAGNKGVSSCRQNQ